MSEIILDTIDDLKKYENDDKFKELKQANSFKGKIYDEIIKLFNEYTEKPPKETEETEEVEEINTIQFNVERQVNYGESIGIRGEPDLIGGWDGTKKEIKFEWQKPNNWIANIPYNAIKNVEKLIFKFVIIRNGSLLWEERANNREMNISEIISELKEKKTINNIEYTANFDPDQGTMYFHFKPDRFR